MPSPRLPVIAIGIALLAVALAAAAVIVLVTRTHAGPNGGSGGGSALALDDGTTTAADVVAVQHIETERAPDGVKSRRDVPAFGLRAGDAIVSLEGEPIDSPRTLELELSSMLIGPPITTLYVEVRRTGVPLLVRRTIVGNVRAAWLGGSDLAAPTDALSTAPSTTPRPALPPPDPSAPADPPPSPRDHPNPYDTSTPDPDADNAALLAGIKKRDDTHYALDRATIDKVLANPMAIAKGARIVPAVTEGKPAGFKLYAIRPTSIYAALGFQNGDTVMAINGVPMTSADKALDAYVKLRDATALEVEIMRRGQPVTLSYSIR